MPEKSADALPYRSNVTATKFPAPLLDRIDIHLHALPLKTRELIDAPSEESSASIKERTTKARQIQWQRFKGLPVLCNAHMESAHLRNFCSLSKDAKEYFN